MFKRVTWMGMGLVAGLGASKWLERKARRRLARLLPVHQLPVRAGAELVERVRGEARERAGEVRDALDVGRTAMRAREDELRDRIYGQAGASGPGPDGSVRRVGRARRDAGTDDGVVELQPAGGLPSRRVLPTASSGRRTRRRRAPAG